MPEDGVVKPFYPDDQDLDPEAVPGVSPDSEIDPGAPAFTLVVDGEVFDVRADLHGGISYTWLSGPNPGYGFGVSPARERSSNEHRENVREFLADVDPTTGYLTED